MSASRSAAKREPSFDVLAENWISLAAAAKLMKRGVTTVWRLCQERKLTWRQDGPGRKIEVTESSVRAYLAAGVREAIAS